VPKAPGGNIKFCSRMAHARRLVGLLKRHVLTSVVFVPARPMMLCRLLGHSVDGRWFDGLHRRGTCKRCDAEMIRRSEGWRAYKAHLDDDPRRRTR
jgi:hypothetical protein